MTKARQQFACISMLLLASVIVLLLTACGGEESLIDGDSPDGDSPDGDDPDGDDPDGDDPDGDDTPVSAILKLDAEDPPDVFTPLSIVELDASATAAAFGIDLENLQFYWDWAEGGHPQGAQDSQLVCDDCSLDPPIDSLIGRWSDSAFAKLYLAVSGDYKIRVRARPLGAESVDGECPDCSSWGEIMVKAVPSARLHAELVWDKGSNIDMDLFMVRHRDNGTFATPRAYGDRIHPPQITMPACTSDADCFDSAFACDTSSETCLNECTSDSDCQAANRGWECSTDGACEVNQNRIIPCDNDDDCGAEGYCSIGEINNSQQQAFCAQHSFEAANDTCFYNSPSPSWGEYESTSTSCNSHAVCLAEGPNQLCGDDGLCLIDNLDDNPTLDIDDVDGWGPENMSLIDPAPGRYRLVVRLYADPNLLLSDEVQATAVLRLFLDGQEWNEGSLSQAFDSPGTYWKAADVIVDELGTMSVVSLCGDEGCNAVEDFEDNPYANPFVTISGGMFDPLSDLVARSIWCDASTDQIDESTTCATLYGE